MVRTVIGTTIRRNRRDLLKVCNKFNEKEVIDNNPYPDVEDNETEARDNPINNNPIVQEEEEVVIVEEEEDVPDNVVTTRYGRTVNRPQYLNAYDTST